MKTLAHFARNFIMSDEQYEKFEALNSRLLQELSVLASTISSRSTNLYNNLIWINRYRTVLLTKASYAIRCPVVRNFIVIY